MNQLAARVYSAWWNVNSHNRLSFAASEWLERPHPYITVRMPDAAR
ncbi:hypothetical protein [Nonomuraea sp. NPDC049141]